MPVYESMHLQHTMIIWGGCAGTDCALVWDLDLCCRRQTTSLSVKLSHLYAGALCRLRTRGSCSGMAGAPNAGEYRLRTQGDQTIQTKIAVARRNFGSGRV